MREKILESLSARLLTVKDGRSHVHWLWPHIEEDFEGALEQIYKLVISKVVLGVVQEASMTSVAVSIGSSIRMHYNEKAVPEETKAAIHCGVKVLEAFCNKDFPERGVKLLDLKLVSNGRNGNSDSNTLYALVCKDEDLLNAIMKSEDLEDAPEFPLLSPAEPWVSSYHKGLRAPLIRGASNSVLKKMTPQQAGPVFEAINKLQKTEFMINQPVFSVYKKLLALNTKAELTSKSYKTVPRSPFKHEREERTASRAGMFLEAQFIQAIAERIGTQSFYQGYNCDFRSRVFPLTPYLHEQSSDNAKGLILFRNKVPLGDYGSFWLALHTANSAGKDNGTLESRVEYVEDNMEEIISWAENPLENTGWMDADKPWSTLACAYEWRSIEMFTLVGGNNIEDYECNLPIFIDGSNNGVQHLAALSLDEKIARLVNLVPTETPGDVYMFAAEKTWEALTKLYDELEDDHLKEQLPRLLKEIKTIKLKREVAETKEDKNAAFAELDEWRKENKQYEKLIYIPFWHQYKDDKKLQRKTVKRPVMTLGYGVTGLGVRNQIFDDTKTLSEALKFKDKSWSNPFADLLRSTMLAELKGPSEMLALFQKLAERANQKNEFLSWEVPLTGFPVVQEYLHTKETRVRVRFCKANKGKGIQLTIQPKEDGKLHKRKQSTSSAPNVIHSFDAAHLTLLVNSSPFTVVTVHDSYGCHPGNMNELFRITREEFANFYNSDPLVSLLTQRDSLDLLPSRGSLDIFEVLKSDFAFC